MVDLFRNSQRTKSAICQEIIADFVGLVHVCGQNRELASKDKVLPLFIDKLQVWTLDKKFQIMVELFR